MSYHNSQEVVIGLLAMTTVLTIMSLPLALLGGVIWYCRKQFKKSKDANSVEN